MPEKRLRRWVTTGLSVAGLLTALLGLLSWNTAHRAADEADRVAHSIQLASTLELTLRHLDDVETGVRGFCLTGAEQFLEPYESGRAGLEFDLRQLRRLTQDRPEHQERLVELTELGNSRLDAAEDLVASRRKMGFIPDVSEFLTGKRIMDRIRSVIGRMEADESARLDRGVLRSRNTRQLTTSAIGWGSVVGVIFFMVAGVSVRREIRGAAEAQAQVAKLNSDLERRVEERTAALQAEVDARERTETKLRGSEDNFRVLLDGIKEYAIYRLDPEGHVASWNAGATRIKGYEAQEIIGKHISCFYRASDQAAQLAERSLQEASRAGRFEEEGLRVRKDGSSFWASAVITPTYGIDGALTGYSKVVQDITERKLADEEVKKQATLLDLALDAIIVRDSAGHIVFWNRGAAQMYGWTSGEAKGHTIHQLLQTAFPIPLTALEEMLEQTGEWEGELQHRTRAGDQVIVTSRMSLQRDEHGGLASILEINRDITDRKRAESALKESDARARFALTTAKLGDWELNLTTMKATRSLLHAQIFGDESLTPDWSHQQFLARVHPEDRVAVDESIKNCIDRGERLEMEYRILLNNGKTRWIWGCGDQHKDEFGKATRVFGIIQDVTERRKTLETVRENEEKFQALANGIPQLACMAEADGSIVWYNQRWYEYTGTDFEGMRGWGWKSTHHPDFLAEVTAKWTNSIANGNEFEMEFPLRGKDGAFRTFLTRVVPYRDGEGRVVRWFGTNTDISERKQTEEQLAAQALELSISQKDLEGQKILLQSVLDSMLEGLIAVDEVGKFILWNPAAEKLLGLGPAIGLSPAEWTSYYGVYLPNSDTPFPSERLPLARALAGEANNTEMVFLNSGLSQKIWVEGNAAPLRDDNGVVTGAVIALRDVTQRKTDELEIRQLNERLEEKIAERTAQLASANHELEAFTYSVSHDLRAPLRHIGGFSKLLISDFGSSMPSEASRYLQRIGDAVIRMGLLVDGLLGLAKLGRLPLQVQSYELNSIVDLVVSILAPECEGRDVEWRIGRLPSLECDRILVGQVFQNLLSNALKYSRGRARAIIEVDSIQHVGQPVTVFVRDNGVGFEMQYATKLFEVFQRMHTDAEFEGTGVGLATVHRIVKKHGGRIWAEAEIDRGATFFFNLGAE
jgi:PAS domain S-box-containing protein